MREPPRLRVANVLEEGRFGGPGRRVTSVAAVLAERGVESVVILPERDSDVLAARLAEAGIGSRSVAITRLSLHPATLLRYVVRFPWEIALLSRVLREVAPDLVHVNGSYQFKAAIAARLAGTPVVWHLNDTMMPWPVRAAFRLTASICADAFVVAGQRVRDYYLDEGLERGRPVVEIHAPVDLQHFAPAEANRLAGATDLVVGTVANVNPTKGLEHFMAAAATLHRTHPDVRFRIAGAELESQRAYSRRLREAAREAGLLDGALEFVGAVEDVPAFLSACDVCVFTSLAEASPTAVWEAMACGRPVVTTDVGSVPRHVENGVTGFVVPVADADAIALRVGELLADPGLRDRLGRAARTHAVDSLSLERAAELHREFYLAVARTH